MALALSGGGDSIALLRLAADWTRANGRRLLALTVDHGISPDSAAWTRFAEHAARAAGADWRGLRWDAPKPATGLSAAARMARHRLIADAARTAGARVVLFAHTAGDIGEAEVMRAEGSTLGRLRDWSPSPVWPEGRGLMLMRPMLGAGRVEIRDWLVGQGADWIDDPANEDQQHARSRARASFRRVDRAQPRMRHGAPDFGPTLEQPPHPLSRDVDGLAAVRSNPFPSGEGWFHLERRVDGPSLAAAVVCAGGGNRLPRRDRLDVILSRLRSGATFTATLCGARIEARDDQLLVTREVGEFARRPLPPLALTSGTETVWDGRWAITAGTPGWSVVPAAGRMTALSEPDRVVLKAMSPAVRGSVPVLIRNDVTAPVLAGTVAKVTSLVEERLVLALDRMTHERDLGDLLHGASPRNPLFSVADITDERAPRRTQGPRRE